jgi:hypothetical protein
VADRQDSPDRRRFLGKALAVASGAGLMGVASHEERVLLAAEGASSSAGTGRVQDLPQGRVGHLTVSRLICGGNLFSGFAHARDLIYVSSLMKQYFTPERILDTLETCEQNGINTAVLRCDEMVTGLLRRYRQQRGGSIQWIAQTYPTEANPLDNVRMAIDNGAVGAFVQGMTADRLVASQRIDVLERVVDYLRQNKLVAGMGSHSLETPQAMLRERLPLDFYFKTFNSVDYHSQKPEEVTEFMRSVSCPWIAFKVLGAGAITPAVGFRNALEAGADFLTVGMFDFQVRENASLLKELCQARLERSRPWRS